MPLRLRQRCQRLETIKPSSVGKLPVKVTIVIFDKRQETLPIAEQSRANAALEIIPKTLTPASERASANEPRPPTARPPTARAQPPDPQLRVVGDHLAKEFVANEQHPTVAVLVVSGIPLS